MFDHVIPQFYELKMFIIWKLMHTQTSCSDDLNLNGFKILRGNVLFKENLNNIILVFFYYY